MFNLITRPVDVIPRMATEITEGTEERPRLCDLCALCGYQVNRLKVSGSRLGRFAPSPAILRSGRTGMESSLRANGVGKARGASLLRLELLAPTLEVGVLGNELDGPVEVGDRELALAPRGVDLGPVPPRHGLARRDPDRAVEVGERALLVPEPVLDPAPVEDAVRGARLERDGPLEVGERPAEVALHAARDAAVHPRRRDPRVQGDRAREVGDRPVVV